MVWGRCKWRVSGRNTEAMAPATDSEPITMRGNPRLYEACNNIPYGLVLKRFKFRSIKNSRYSYTTKYACWWDVWIVVICPPIDSKRWPHHNHSIFSPPDSFQLQIPKYFMQNRIIYQAVDLFIHGEPRTAETLFNSVLYPSWFIFVSVKVKSKKIIQLIVYINEDWN